MDNIKKDVDTLFSKANIKDSNKLETEFQAIMKQGEKPIKQCGKYFYFLTNTYQFNIFIQL